VVVFARHNDIAVSRNNQISHKLEKVRCLTRLILLIHFIQQRERKEKRIDECRGMATSLAGVQHKPGGLDPLPFSSHRSINYGQIQ